MVTRTSVNNHHWGWKLAYNNNNNNNSNNNNNNNNNNNKACSMEMRGHYDYLL